MIVWPDEKRVKTEGREGLRRFRETAAAAELEASKETWRVTAWPWTVEAPTRVMLENDARDVVSVTITEGGLWQLSDEGRLVRLRTEEELARDALGLPAIGSPA